MSFKSGFVTILGKPNAGKSTLLNAIVGEKLSIATAKAQTTRHRIKGILTTGEYQMVFSDTPGVLEPKYELHKSMMKAVNESIEDADVVVLLIDATQPVSEIEELAGRFRNTKPDKIIAINKTDAVDYETLQVCKVNAQSVFPDAEVVLISSLQRENIDLLLTTIAARLPEQNAFFGSDELTDRSERFLVTELIREKIFEQFHQEIPYSAEVIIQDWKQEVDIIKIRADIIVERESQKAIMLGKGGASIKQLGTEARKSIEEFLRIKIFLGLTVKLNPDWRRDPDKLKYFGY